MTPMSPFSSRRAINRRHLMQAGAVAGAGLMLPRQFAGSAAASQSDLSGTFRALSWEGEAEMRKWLLHMNTFFDTNYPDMELQIDYGISWEEYWTKLQTTIAGGAPLDMCWMHDSRCPSYAALGMLMPLDEFIAESAAGGMAGRLLSVAGRCLQVQRRAVRHPL